MTDDEIIRARVQLVAGMLGPIYIQRRAEYSAGGGKMAASIAVTLADAALDEMIHKPYHAPEVKDK